MHFEMYILSRYFAGRSISLNDNPLFLVYIYTINYIFTEWPHPKEYNHMNTKQ